ncbi:MAG: phage tail sheath subtilisin-like domain-containing protein [Lachnospiraceae bacterium]|nr:phage tail sheath subtilisin-like domain-containing protein [Lachnospiraceae bacterium]
MSGFFVVGERKDRPGVYHRYVNDGPGETAGARDGIGCCVVTGNWGALNTPVTVEAGTDVATVVGSGSGYDTVTQMRTGGVEEIVVCRVGTGGSKGDITLKDSEDADVVKLTALYPGSRALTITIRDSLTDDTKKQAIIYEDSTQLESVTFDAGEDEVNGLISALAESNYVTASLVAAGSGTLADVSQSAFSVGTDPTVTASAYSEGFSAVEAEEWDHIVVDTNDSAVHTLLKAFLDRIYEAGAYPRATVAESSSVALDTRMENAAGYNSELMHYVLNSWVDSDGTVMEGYLAAARIGGLICSTATNESLTHTVISSATSLNERLTNSQVSKALSYGCIVLTVNKSKQIWIEKAINTLVTLAGNQDAGWKKIRRTGERLELMSRIDETLEDMIGKVDNDADGRASVIAAAQRVVDAMIGEKKLISGTVTEDESNPAEGDSAWFIVAVDDLDSIETIYLTFKFRYTSDDDEE